MTTNLTPVQATAGDGVQAIIDAARDGVDPFELEPGKFYTVHTPRGVETIDLTGDEWLGRPRRKTGTVTVRDVGSFTQYWEKHHDDASEVFADVDHGIITAVLDAHGSGGEGARWQGHRVRLVMEKTLQWKTWMARNGHQMRHKDFAEFIEDNLPDIRSNPEDERPVSAAEMLEIAQTLQVSVRIEFKASERLANGDRVFQWAEETTEARAGVNGKLRVPEAFSIFVAPYTDLDVGPVRVRFRHRRSPDGVTFSYHLDQPQEKERAAVLAVVTKVEAEAKVAVMKGSPSQ